MKHLLGAAYFLCREELKLCLENVLNEYSGEKALQPSIQFLLGEENETLSWFHEIQKMI